MSPDTATRFLFFTGKGGVGKTSHACAAAVRLADEGRRVLLVSTDPASNLDDVLGTDVGSAEAAVLGAPGLRAVNIDPLAAAARYRERAIGPVRGVLPEEVVRQVEEQLSGGCTVEVAAFDEFAALLTDEGRIGGYDHVVFDTAPTGHTLRLLRLPAAWSGFLAQNPRGAGCLGPMGTDPAQQGRYRRAMEALADPARTTLLLVSRPDPAALAEAARTSAELAELGLRNQRLVLNGIFHASDPADPLARALEARGVEAVAAMPPELAALPRAEVPLRPENVLGIEALRALARGAPVAAQPADAPGTGDLPPLALLADEIAAAGHGLVLVMGKGGVGKTTLAAALAVELAGRGVAVHLSTTDPAAHLAGTLAADVPGLRVSRIDPEAEVRAYTRSVLDTAGRGLDDEGRALLEEDLRSPCTEEVAVFHAFSRLVREARRGVVVLDTAPTGHTLLLLDATGAYHREVLRTAVPTAGAVTTPLMRLRDPAYTRVLVATLPETTPVREAEALQEDLRRAGIEPYAWVVNQSLAAAAPSDPLLVQRAAAEEPLLERVRTHAARMAVVPMMAEAPVGPERLRTLCGGATAAA